MPNWCSNTLTVYGDKETLDAFIERAGSGDHDYVGPFNKRKEGGNGLDWEGFTSIQMELFMRDNDLFEDKSDVKSPFSFHAFVPVPREVLLAPYDPNRLKEAKEKYPEWFGRFPNLIAGYDWENRNWGCKWGASDVALVYNDTHSSGLSMVEYEFQTAWSPPMDFMHSLAAQYPTLKFCLFYREEGMGFEGNAEWEGGVCTMDDQRDCEEEEEEDEGIVEGEPSDDGVIY